MADPTQRHQDGGRGETRAGDSAMDFAAPDKVLNAVDAIECENDRNGPIAKPQPSIRREQFNGVRRGTDDDIEPRVVQQRYSHRKILRAGPLGFQNACSRTWGMTGLGHTRTSVGFRGFSSTTGLASVQTVGPSRANRPGRWSLWNDFDRHSRD